jgi:hypothetical protein
MNPKVRKLFKGFLQNILKVFISKNERDRQTMRKMNLVQLQQYTIIRAKKLKQQQDAQKNKAMMKIYFVQLMRPKSASSNNSDHESETK